MRFGAWSDRRLAVVAVLGAVALTGCSGSDDDPSDQPTAGAIELTDEESATVSPPPGGATTPGAPTDLESSTPSSTPSDPGGTVGELDPSLAAVVPDLCRLFSRDDFQQVLGAPAEGSATVPEALAPVYSSCSYAGPSDYPSAVLTAYAEDEVADILDDARKELSELVQDQAKEIARGRKKARRKLGM